MREPELARRRELSVRAEARLGVADVIERRILRVLLGVIDPDQLVLRAALGGNAPGVADETAELDGRNELSVAGAGRRRDRLVDQRTAHVVAARCQQELRQLWPFLDPRRLDVAEGRAQEAARDRVHLPHL